MRKAFCKIVFGIFLLALGAHAESCKEMKSQIDSLKKELEIQRQPDLPIQVSFREAMANATQVLQIKSFATTELRIKVSWDADGVKKEQLFQVPPNGVQFELGHQEGFPLNHRDGIALSATGYRPIFFAVP